MKYFVYYSYGGCNDGDHQWELEEFDTFAEAEHRRDEILKAEEYATIDIIHGTKVWES